MCTYWNSINNLSSVYQNPNEGFQTDDDSSFRYPMMVLTLKMDAFWSIKHLDVCLLLQKFLDERFVNMTFYTITRAAALPLSLQFVCNCVLQMAPNCVSCLLEDSLRYGFTASSLEIQKCTLNMFEKKNHQNKSK